jgi:hypothetical protein
MPMPIDTFRFIRHEDILRNMGLTGRKFIEKHKDQVLEMKRTLLEYMKATRLEAADHPDQANQADAAFEATQVRINEKGYPVIPDQVMERQLPKSECETMMRAYMNRHYCEWVG